MVAAGDRASECTFFAQGVRKLTSEKQCRSNFCQHITRFYAKNAPQQSFPKTSKIYPKLAQNRRKTCPEAPESSQEHQRSNRYTFFSIFLRKKAQPYLWFSPILAQQMLKNAIEKTVTKRLPPKTTFIVFFYFSGVARTILFNFGSQNGSQEGPGVIFVKGFPTMGFQHDFCNSFGQKNAKPKKM